MAFKIFELGLKKYGDIPEYILAYIDYLSHLNGTNALHPHITHHLYFKQVMLGETELKQGRVASH